MAQKHVSFGKQLLRALLGVIAAAGFFCLWVALLCQLGFLHPYFLFGAGATVLALSHMLTALKKQRRYRSR